MRLSQDDDEDTIAGRWKFGEDCIRHKVKESAKKIQSLKCKVIVYGGFDSKEIHPTTTDGVNYGTEEFRKTPSTKYYNHKKNGCGVKYAFMLALRRVSLWFLLQFRST